MDLDLKDRSVLITGGSKGIGLATALAFAREGARITIAGRDEERLAAARTALSNHGASDIESFIGDLSQSDDRQRLFAAHGVIDILVNNAGAIPGGNLLDLPLERWMESWQLKVFGYIHLTQLYLSAMKERGEGVIINIIGSAGQAPRWDYICGSSGNAALMALTRAAGAKSVDWNVRILGINPAPTRTERVEVLARKKAQDLYGDESRWAETLSGLPFGRPSEPIEIADLAVMLASRRASYLSGTIVDIDGGQMYR